MWMLEVENPRAAIVIVHGAFEHQGRYKWLTEMWKAHGMNVVIGDLPGQGISTRRRGHIESFDVYIDTITQWVQEAENYHLPIFLLGHSMGGLAVIRALQEKNLPVQAVILSSPCLGLVEGPPKGLEWASRALNLFMPTLRVPTNLEPNVATRNKEIMELDENDSLYVTKVSVRWYRELVKAMQLAMRNIEKLPDIPMLLMQAGADKIVDKVVVKEWFDKLKIKEKLYKEWTNLYHEIFNEPEREEVFKYAKGFIELQLQKSLG
ncbi:alpha/beta hydrolase [Calidifontibacillus erzurumensis]|uniref:Alpha/beta hydrolase n=1 Tax=Calidifontibacillus erzurumensis TaxID=2741433 RepID=A0A8J8GCL0_9BACI|nr:alpha/beta hydrolase [Calidifontibacillus erzurumensis]NSL51349.1 alpha/beta hydrolase [Calidifontibacillus erzurumensis]